MAMFILVLFPAGAVLRWKTPALTLIQGSNRLFGAIMVLAMHAGFAFPEVATLRQKSQVNGLSKSLADFAISAIACFFVGYGPAATAVRCAVP